MSRDGRALATFLAAGVALLFAIPVASASSTAPFSSYDTGQLKLVVPTTLPEFDLRQDANVSIGASLVLDRIVELDPSLGDGSSGPSVVAVAYPTHAVAFNGSSASGSHPSVTVSAGLTVYRGLGVLFPTHGTFGPAGSSVPIAPTFVRISVDPGASPDRVLVSSLVQGWPWLDSHDLLAFAWGFQASGSQSFDACVGTVSSVQPSRACATAFPENGSTWGTAFGEIRGIGPTGTLADVSWGPSASSTSGPVPIFAGAAAAANGSAELVLAAAGNGSSHLEVSMVYSLVVPPSLTNLLHFEALPYLAGLLLAGGLGGAGLVLARRRERTVLETL
jgi:hypothetical protein